MSEDDSNDVNGNELPVREGSSIPEVKSFTEDSDDIQLKVSPQLDSEKDAASRKLWNSYESNSQESNSTNEIKPTGGKKFKGQLKNYLQTTRRRKTPFRASNSTAKAVTRSSTNFYPGLEASSSSSSWYNYRNLFGRNFLSPTNAKTDDCMQNYAMCGYGSGSTRNSYNYQGWEFDRAKSDEDAYCGMFSGDHTQASSFTYALPYSNNDYSSAYEAYSAAVAAAAVVAAASGQGQCSEYSTSSTLPHPHEQDSYDGAVRVIRSPLFYNTPLQEQQTYLSHRHPIGDHQHQGLPSFSGYLHHKEETNIESGGNDLISKLALKTDSRMTQSTWFSQISLGNGMEKDGKTHSQTQMSAYQQHQILAGTTDTTTRSTSV